MRVRMKTIYAGPAGNYQPGDLADFAAKEGKALVDGGFADEIGKPERRSPTPSRETATPPAPQTATPPAPQTATPPAPETGTLTADAPPLLSPPVSGQ